MTDIRRRSLLKTVPAFLSANALGQTTAPRNFRKKDRMVMTYFFTWYNWQNPVLRSAEHITTPNGVDYLTLHPSPQTVAYDRRSDYRKRGMPNVSGQPVLSYANPDWFRSELNSMIANGIDVAAFDFWGFPWLDAPPRSRFSLEVMNTAIDRMDIDQQPCPSVTMFMETTPLGVHGRPTDLETEDGAQWMFGLIRDFYSRVSPHRVALFEGKVAVILYESTPPGGGLNLSGYGLRRCKDLFRAWYGRDLVFFGNNNWNAKTSGQITYTCHWGAARRPDRIMLQTDLPQLSPGYNYLGETKGTPPSPDLYRGAWEKLRKSGANWVAIETWNEWHESTGIAKTVEGGDELLRITQSQARRFKNGQ